MTPDEEAKANRQGSLLFALGGREGLHLRAVRPMEHRCRRQLYHEKRSRDGRGTGEIDCFLQGFVEFLPPSKRDLLTDSPETVQYSGLDRLSFVMACGRAGAVAK